MNFFNLVRCLFLLGLLFSGTIRAMAETTDQHIKVALRNIGHEFLLELNDSTSRVLPIEEVNGRYAVKFERTFSFEPDVLSFLTWKFLAEANLDASYIVEVEPCGISQVVHSFEVSPASKDSAVACAGRTLPEDCYVFYFTVMEAKPVTIGTIEKVNPADSTKQSSSNYGYLFLLLAAGAAAVWFLRPKKGKPEKKFSQDLIQMGQFKFDQKSMLLYLNGQSIELSSKEADLLFLLFSNENKTLDRAYILNVVWGDAGDYVGRTLDVFISKLRKKLEGDPALKIINIRGVGYKFVIS